MQGTDFGTDLKSQLKSAAAAGIESQWTYNSIPADVIDFDVNSSSSYKLNIKTYFIDNFKFLHLSTVP